MSQTKFRVFPKDRRRICADLCRKKGVNKYRNGELGQRFWRSSWSCLIGGADTGADGLNNLNQIVGHDSDRGAFWKSPSAAPVELPPLPGNVFSGATRINDDGFVIGGSNSDLFSPAVSVVWRVTVDATGVVHVDGPLPLGPLPGGSDWWGYEINEAVNGVSQVAGYSSVPKEAVTWTVSLNPDGTLALPGAPIPVGTLGLFNPSWSDAKGINNFGEICGRSDKRPFVDFGAGPQPLSVPRDTQDGYAFKINDASEIVGTLDIRKKKGGTIGPARWHAYLWRDGQMIDLNTQIGSNSGWDKLEWATNINNAGVISGFGRFDVSHRGFLLIPNEP